jgi:hypothetical protein
MVLFDSDAFAPRVDFMNIHLGRPLGEKMQTQFYPT